MAFDLTKLKAAVAEHGRVARVVIADVKGSSPREVGAAMLVWEGGQSGTIGGGALELMAAQRALQGDAVTHHALGPELGQCCGGAVTLLTEVYDAKRITQITGDIWPRGAGEMPLSVKRLLSKARAQGADVDARYVDGWMIERIFQPNRPLWIWGAGHVGRAIVATLNPLPDFEITWADTSDERFPAEIPADVIKLIAAKPEVLAPHAPSNAEHLILTYSHSIDLNLCHALLSHKFAFAGLIGSKTKWARFRSRLAQLGHAPAQIERITCPIGQKSLGKHPYAIAIGVGAALLERKDQKQNQHGWVA